MKFTQKITLYTVNEDNTVTFFILDESGTAQYFRANARLKLLVELSELPKITDLIVTIGVYYQRGKGLALQIIDMVIDDSKTV